MGFKTICNWAAWVSCPFGLAFALAPAPTAVLYGVVAADPVTLLVGRYFGAECLMYAAAAWGLRGLVDAGAQRTAAGGLALATLVGLVVTLHGVLGGTLNALGWSSVALYGLFTLAWARLAWASAADPAAARVGVHRG